jgi:hypothetical protein
MYLQFKRYLGMVPIVIGALIVIATSSSLAQDITLPEKILFQSNHFSNIKKPVKLNYTFHEDVKSPEAFNDKVSVDILSSHTDGTASVAVRFLSGTHAISIAPIQHAQGNPVILGFLEHDIAEMKRLTGGASGYFRKRIRMALAVPDIPVKKIKISYAGKQVIAQEITVYPYIDDPLKSRLGKYENKGYVFVTSDVVPGTLYRAYTTMAVENSIRRSVATTMAIDEVM